MKSRDLFMAICLTSFTLTGDAQDTTRPPTPKAPPKFSLAPPRPQPGVAADDASSAQERQLLDQYAQIAQVSDPKLRVALALRVAVAADNHLTTGLTSDLRIFDATVREVGSINAGGLPGDLADAWSTFLKQRSRFTIAARAVRESPNPENEKQYHEVRSDLKASADKLSALLPDIQAPGLTASEKDMGVRNEVATWLQQISRKPRRPIFC